MPPDEHAALGELFWHLGVRRNGIGGINLESSALVNKPAGVSREPVHTVRVISSPYITRSRLGYC